MTSTVALMMPRANNASPAGITPPRSVTTTNPVMILGLVDQTSLSAHQPLDNNWRGLASASGVTTAGDAAMSVLTA